MSLPLPNNANNGINGGNDNTMSLSSDYYLQLEAQYNKRLNGELKTLMQSFADILDIAKMGSKDRFTVAHEKLQMDSKVAGITRATSNLALLARELKQLFLLNDVQTISEIASLRKGLAQQQILASTKVLNCLTTDAEALVDILNNVLHTHTKDEHTN